MEEKKCPWCRNFDAHVEMDEREDGRLECCRCGYMEEVSPGATSRVASLFYGGRDYMFHAPRTK